MARIAGHYHGWLHLETQGQLHQHAAPHGNAISGRGGLADLLMPDSSLNLPNREMYYEDPDGTKRRCTGR